jgi:hypothetical protein
VQRDDGRPFQRDRIRRDRNYAIELKYACAHGIPWSRYLRMFDRVDRARVIANELEEGSRCSMCGTAQWEWDEDPGAYEAVPMTCPGCKERDQVREQQDGQKPGVSIRLLPRALAQRVRETPRRRPRSPRELAGKSSGRRRRK